MQHFIVGMLLKAGVQAGLRYPEKLHRTAACRRKTVGRAAEIHHCAESHRSHYLGLETCRNVWTCPCCAAQISEQRRREISVAMATARALALEPVLVTLTIPHHAWQGLADLRRKLMEARSKLRAGSPWKHFMQRIGFQGLIAACEITHGRNGWHLHYHELWFVSPGADAELLRSETLEHWERRCRRVGLLPTDASARRLAGFLQHAVDVKVGCDSSEYLAKFDDQRHWGVDHEIAKASTKSGRAAGCHPFELAARWAEKGDAEARRLFLEYARAMTGKHQLHWSRGLKAKLGVADRSAKELAEIPADLEAALDRELEADSGALAHSTLAGERQPFARQRLRQRERQLAAIRVATLTEEEWFAVRRLQQRAQVLEASEAGGAAAVADLVAWCVARNPRSPALVRPKTSRAGAGPPSSTSFATPSSGVRA